MSDKAATPSLLDRIFGPVPESHMGADALRLCFGWLALLAGGYAVWQAVAWWYASIRYVGWYAWQVADIEGPGLVLAATMVIVVRYGIRRRHQMQEKGR